MAKSKSSSPRAPYSGARLPQRAQEQLGRSAIAFIGSLFAGTAKSGAALNWNGEEFVVGYAWAKDGGSRDSVRSMAGQVGELLNGVVAASGSQLVDARGVQTGAYETKGKRFIYKVNAAGQYAFTSKDVSRVVNHGAFIALYDVSERLIGGDVYVKRSRAVSERLSLTHTA